MAGIFQNGIYIESFDTYTTVSQKWDATNNVTPIISTGASRFGVGQGMTMSNGGATKFLNTNVATFTVGFAYKIAAIFGTTQALMNFGDLTNTLNQISLCVNPNATLQFYAGTAGISGTVFNGSLTRGLPSIPITLGVWSYMEVKFSAASSGLAELRLGGASLPAISFSGNTLCSTGSPGSYTSAFSFTYPTGSFQVDDMYMLDGSGTGLLATYLGDVRITTVVPTGDSGTGGLNVFTTTPSQTTGNHYLNVKEIPPDDNTSYNSDATPGDRESYRVGTLALTGQIIAVNQLMRAEKDDANVRSIAAMARNNSVDSSPGTTFTLPSSYLYINQIWLTDPNTGVGWTQSGFNTAEFGLVVIS